MVGDGLDTLVFHSCENSFDHFGREKEEIKGET